MPKWPSGKQTASTAVIKMGTDSGWEDRMHISWGGWYQPDLQFGSVAQLCPDDHLKFSSSSVHLVPSVSRQNAGCESNRGHPAARQRSRPRSPRHGRPHLPAKCGACAHPSTTPGPTPAPNDKGKAVEKPMKSTHAKKRIRAPQSCGLNRASVPGRSPGPHSAG